MLDQAQPDGPDNLERFLPREAWPLADIQTDLPRIARDPKLTAAIAARRREIPTSHTLRCHDARDLSVLADESVQLVLTSPPYWTLKDYRDSDGQLGHIEKYGEFLAELDKVWRHCFRVLVPGGRLIVVVGDVCLSRRKNGGRHTVVPLHASIQEHCRSLGYDNLAPIIWHKIANAAYEVQGGGGGFLGKPYEPNSVIKNDIEFILMQRKPGGYRSPSIAARVLSVISAENHRVWFQQIWHGVTGASTKDHPAPYPVELAERLIQMFSFVGDTVLDPFAEDLASAASRRPAAPSAAPREAFRCPAERRVWLGKRSSLSGGLPATDAGGSARMPPLRTSTGTSPRSSGASERNPMKLLRDYQGLAIRLTDERLAHILEHPEMAGLAQAIEETLLQPERVIESFSDPTAKLHYRYYAKTLVGGKYLCVVVKTVDVDAFVLTAYLTDKIKRGISIWPKDA